MAANPSTPAKAGPEAAPEKASGAAAPAGGGFKAWLPLLMNIILMPILAYSTVAFLIQPKNKAVPVSARESGKSESHGAAKKGEGKEKINTPLSGKIIVNVAGTMGTRYLVANLSLVSFDPAIKTLVEKNDAELRDAAAGALSVKTISDLEKPGARNLVRTELISVFNNILGQGTITDIYLTEFAVQ